MVVVLAEDFAALGERASSKVGAVVENEAGGFAFGVRVEDGNCLDGELLRLNLWDFPPAGFGGLEDSFDYRHVFDGVFERDGDFGVFEDGS